MRQGGFTLVELLITLAVLGILIPLCLQLEATTVAHIQSTRLHTEATRLAENLMEWELAQPLSVTTHGVDGLFNWQLERNGDELRVRVLWSERGQERGFEVVTLVAGR